ncbi:MAG TPA: hypothetical protein VEQ18_01050, partial [Candidatus Nitrosocosmicus sp.]|nr:hypothetical protein [Candidatus Nitrosocosmicus sp.]
MKASGRGKSMLLLLLPVQKNISRSNWTAGLDVDVFFLDEQPAKGGALPKFGAWDVKDPNAGDGFTMIFQKLSNEKKEGGPVHIPR